MSLLSPSPILQDVVAMQAAGVLPTIGGNGAPITSMAYSSGQLTGVTGPGYSVDYTYNADGSLNTVTENGRLLGTYAYNADGSIASFN